MERQKAWDKVRESIPGSFYNIVKAKNLEREIRLSKPVLNAQVHFTPFTDLDKYYRQLAQLDEQLEEERELSKVKEAEFAKRWDLAYERQKDMEGLLKIYAQYHDECQRKIAKDKVRTKSAHEAINDKDREIQKLHKEIQKLKEVKAVIEKRRKLCEPFKDFMNNIVKTAKGEEYESIQDLIARFDDLKQIREEKTKKTLEHLEEGVKSVELLNFEQQHLLEEELAYLEHLSRLDDYNKELEGYSEVLTEKVIGAKSKTHLEILEMERSKTAIYSLYLNLCQEMNKPIKIQEDNKKEQLEFIQKYLEGMKKLTERVKECLKGGSEIVVVSETAPSSVRKGKSSTTTKLMKEEKPKDDDEKDNAEPDKSDKKEGKDETEVSPSMGQ